MNRFLPRWRPWLLLAAGLLGLGAFLGFQLAQEHQQIEAVERERLTTQSKVIEDNLARQLVAINLALESVMAEMPFWAGQPDGRERALRRLKSMEVSMPSVRTFVVMDAAGTITLSSRDELIGRNFSERAYFQVHRRSKNPSLLHVSAPFQSVLNNYVINLTRAINGPRGTFEGVVSATVNTMDIRTLLNSVRYADDMTSMLVHGDGKIFVSQPELDGVIGMDISVPGSFFRQHLDSKRPVSDFHGLSPANGDQRLRVMRTIHPADLAMDTPLVVSLNRSLDALYAPWQRDARNQLLAFVLFSLLCVAGLHIYQRQRLQQRAVDQRLKLATEAAGVGIWEFEPASRKYHWDGAMFELFGLDLRSVSTRNDDWKQLLLPGELERIRTATRAVIHHGQALDLTFQVRRPDGEVRFLRNRAALHVADPGTPLRLIGTTEDVTERKLREADLRIAAAAFESHQCMTITDARSVILRVNRAFTEQFGYGADEVIGQTPRILQSGRHDTAFYTALWSSLHRDHAWQGEIWNRRKNGEVFPVWLSITAVASEEGVVTHYVATHADITLRKAADEAINLLAFHDPLTHLPNRRLLQDRLHQAVVHAKRDNQHLALMFIDLDRFKPVNDKFGHMAGDELLQTVARRLLACVRESDTVARVGGDEFVVLLPRIEGAQDALVVARKIHVALHQPFNLPGGGVVNISSSTGIAIYPDHARDETTLTNHADEAMYQAKAAGRDRFVLFTPDSEPTNVRPPTDSGGATPPVGQP